MNTSVLGSALAVAVLTLTGCSGPIELTTPKSEPNKGETVAPAVPVTAKTAFWEMYKPAYAWAADLWPLTIEAKTVSGIKNEGGKAAMWVAVFGSPRRREYCKFTYSVAARPPDIRKGISADKALPWAGPRPDAWAITTSDWTIDSDEAYKTARATADAWLLKHPGKELTTFSLGAASNFPGPVWVVLWGDKDDGFLTRVSASTGKVLK